MRLTVSEWPTQAVRKKRFEAESDLSEILEREAKRRQVRGAGDEPHTPMIREESRAIKDACPKTYV
jgi:hypothetical protein